MNISKDYSYIRGNEKVLMDKGYGEMTVHSLHFDRYYTEEQMEQNRLLSHSMTNEEWSKHCDEVAESFAVPMAEILKQFVEKYDIHQVTDETSTMKHYNSDWDLFFWSDRGWNKKAYMTHFTLSFNERRSPKQNMALLEEIIPLVETLEQENIGCRIQYDAFLDEAKIEKEANAICESLVGKFIDYHGMTGKIRVIGEENGKKEYGFFKKNARNHYYTISNADILMLHL